MSTHFRNNHCSQSAAARLLALAAIWTTIFGLVTVCLTNPAIGSQGVDSPSATQEQPNGQTAALASPTSNNAARPNVLLIYLDDFGWRDTGYMGSDFYETPVLDRLAREGMVFSNAYSSAANCAPARACLLTGQYTPRHQIYNVGTQARGKPAHRRLLHVPGTATLDTKFITWAQRLQAAGYRTAAMGKWHLSDDPTQFGFDVNIGGSHRGGPPQGYYPPHPKVANLGTTDSNEYLTDRLSDEACQFIESNADKPWLLYLSHFAVHTPLDAKRELLEKYQQKPAGKLHSHIAMATMIEAVDQGVGKIMKTLRRLNLDEQTVILFTSDNGGYGPATDMAPLKGYKGTYYEGGIRVPMFVRWPGVIKPAQETDEPVIGVDFYPTICEIAGVEIGQEQRLDGVSLVPLLQGETTRLGNRSSESPIDGAAQPTMPRPLFWHFPAYLESYRQVTDEQRDVLFRSRPCSVVRLGRWKLIEYFESGELELFNLKTDESESNNLADHEIETRERLLSILQAWQRETNAAIPRELNSAFNAETEAAAIKRITNRQAGQQLRRQSSGKLQQ